MYLNQTRRNKTNVKYVLNVDKVLFIRKACIKKSKQLISFVSIKSLDFLMYSSAYFKPVSNKYCETNKIKNVFRHVFFIQTNLKSFLNTKPLNESFSKRVCTRYFYTEKLENVFAQVTFSPNNFKKFSNTQFLH